MRFKLDENLPVELVDVLAEHGFQATTVKQEGLGGAADAGVAAVCQREGRALFTLDRDFADIRRYPPEEFQGLIVLRVRNQEKEHVIAVVRRVIRVLARTSVEGCLWIAEETRIRTRGGAL